MEMPSGRRSSEPVPLPKASGSPPRGGHGGHHDGPETEQAGAQMDSCGGSPSTRSASSAKSIIMMAFFFTMPINNTMPMRAMMLNSVPVNMSARNAPTPAEGKVDRIVTGWM